MAKIHLSAPTAHAVKTNRVWIGSAQVHDELSDQFEKDYDAYHGPINGIEFWIENGGDPSALGRSKFTKWMPSVLIEHVRQHGLQRVERDRLKQAEAHPYGKDAKAVKEGRALYPYTVVIRNQEIPVYRDALGRFAGRRGEPKPVEKKSSAEAESKATAQEGKELP